MCSWNKSQLVPAMSRRFCPNTDLTEAEEYEATALKMVINSRGHGWLAAKLRATIEATGRKDPFTMEADYTWLEDEAAKHVERCERKRIGRAKYFSFAWKQ